MAKAHRDITGGACKKTLVNLEYDASSRHKARSGQKNKGPKPPRLGELRIRRELVDTASAKANKNYTMTRGKNAPSTNGTRHATSHTHSKRDREKRTEEEDRENTSS